MVPVCRAAASSGSGPVEDGVGRRRRCATASPRSRPSSRSRPEFPPEVEAAAAAAAAAARGCPTSTAPTSRSSPSTRPASRDLDQALHLERDGDGYVVHYAIADVAAFVTPGDPVDVEAQPPRRDAVRRGLQDPAAPDGALRGRRARCCPTRSGPALLWTITARRRRASGTDVHVERALVRSTRPARLRRGAAARSTTARADESLTLLKEVGELRLAPRGRPRRGVAAAARAGGRHRGRPRGTWSSASMLPVERVERPDLAAHRLRRRRR